LLPAVREKGVELENILLEEKKKAEDLNSKLTFYGGAYSKLSNKLQGMWKIPRAKAVGSVVFLVLERFDSL
jgi:hypothetical protein